MTSVLTLYEVIASLTNAAAGILYSAAAPSVSNGTTSYVYYDNTFLLANSSNIVNVSWADVESAFEHPEHRDTASFEGLDWTRPYPGVAVDGFQAHLRIANDVPFPESVVRNQSTELSAITYSIPESMMADGVPKAMDPSWYVCQHYYISTVPDPTVPVQHDCGFLSQKCRAAMQNDLTREWMLQDPQWPCSRIVFDYIPVDCQDQLGLITADVLAYDSTVLSDTVTAETLLVDKVARQSWMVGTGFVDSGNTTAYYDASNRTYIIGTVFGYRTATAENKKHAPKLSLACLRPEWVEPPPSPTETETEKVTPYVYPEATASRA